MPNGRESADCSDPAPPDPAVSKRLRDIIEKADEVCGRWNKIKLYSVFHKR